MKFNGLVSVVNTVTYERMIFDMPKKLSYGDFHRKSPASQVSAMC